MKRSDIRQGLIAVEQGKTGKKLWIPMHAELKRILSDIPAEGEFVLTSARGEEWTSDGFKTAWSVVSSRKSAAPRSSASSSIAMRWP